MVGSCYTVRRAVLDYGALVSQCGMGRFSGRANDELGYRRCRIRLGAVYPTQNQGKKRASVLCAYEGPWTRKLLIQYAYNDSPRRPIHDADDLPIDITYEGNRTLRLNVAYDAKSRGEVEGRVVFATENGLIGEGSYVYVNGPLRNREDNAGFAHSGRYSVHIFPEADPDVLRVYYDGLMPDHNARGYEIWQRDNQGSP